MKLSRCRYLAVACAALFTVLSPPLSSTALAAPRASVDKTARAAELKRAADAAFDAKHYEEALALYDQSFDLAPQAAIFYNRGRALQYLARYPQALTQLERFAAEASPAVRAKVPGFARILADVRAHVATVDVRCDVDGARVLIGGIDFGTVPLASAPKINAGKQEVEILADGYYVWKREYSFAGDATTTVRADLASRGKNGLLVVRSSVEGARLLVDGQAIGVTSAETVVLGGEHTVLATRDGFDDGSTSVLVKPGERREVTLDPLKRPSIVTRWWFWTGIGLVAAGAVAVGVAATTEKAAPIGNFSPGTVKF